MPYWIKKSYQTHQNQWKSHDEVGLKSATISLQFFCAWVWYEQQGMKSHDYQDSWLIYLGMKPDTAGSPRSPTEVCAHIRWVANGESSSSDIYIHLHFKKLETILFTKSQFLSSHSYSSVNSCWGQPPPPGKCGAFARLNRPEGGAIVKLAEAEGWVLALLEHSVFFQREDFKEGDVCCWEMKFNHHKVRRKNYYFME